ncbi:MAG TPA: ABC transporter permease [Bryobacteraceae bacterium]|nr:ABC transporter permease [Bryobacteraceae bacterium]
MVDVIRSIWSDLVYAARSLAKAPAFTFVCIVSLGIGMAPVIAVPYGARVLRMPPPGVNPDGLVEVITTANKSREAANSWSYADFMDLRHSNTGIALIGWATAPSEITLPGGEKTALWPMYVSADYFQTIGVRLARGPGFEGQTGASVIVGYRFWQNQLSADPKIIGKTLKLDNTPYVVAGIAPEGFQGHLALQGRDLFVPLERYPLLLTDSNARFDRSKEWLHIHGRLAKGVSMAQASAAVAGITSQLAKEYPATNELKAGIVEPYDPLGVPDRSQFRVLETVGLTLTGALLLVICLNLSGMMQVRSAMRERELSVRQAVGASRLRLAGHLFAETVLLAAAGGTLASVVLFNAPTVVSRLTGQPIPLPFQNALKVDASMITICIGLCLLTSLVFGFLPALRFSRPALISALKDGAGGGGLRVGRVHRFTAALQVGIAVPLLVLGGISLDRVRSTATSNLGFASDLLYAAPLDLDSVSETGGNIDFRIRRLRDNLAKANGIASVTVADGLPLDFHGRPATVSLQTEAPALAHVQVTRVGDGYLKTMAIPLLTGRDFDDRDSAGSEKVTIITKPLADQLFPNAGAGEPIGKRLVFRAAGETGAADKPTEALTIVGVAGDFPTSQMSTERAQLLLPLAQRSDIRLNSVVTDERSNRIPNLFLIARSAAGEQPQKITAAMENVVRELDPKFRRDRIITGVSLRRKSMDDFLTQAAVAGAAASVVLLLSALGIYGVIGLMVAARTREIAVRVALGASQPRVLGMILLDVVKLTAPGVGVGLLLTAALIRVNGERMGISLSHMETLAYVAGAAIAILVAVVAGLAPARRAASVLPMVAMRSE